MNINQTIKKSFSRAAMMLLATILFSLTAQPAWAETVDGVKYIDANGDEQTRNGVIVLTDSETKLGVEGTESSPTETWYLCKEDLSYTSTLSSHNYSNVNIILADGVKMSVESSSLSAIYIQGSLGIYGQSTGNNRGALTAEGTTYGIVATNDVTISNSKVTATGTSDGIGIHANNDVTISSSEVTAEGYSAISTPVGGVSIIGGKVTANGTYSGIEARGSDKAIAITIIGAVVEATATDDTDGNAIKSWDGSISISDGSVVTANGTSRGIQAYNDVTISNAEVTATATGTSGKAIFTESGVSITGSKVTANGTSEGISAFNGGVVLDWTNATDFIFASSYEVGDGKVVKTADGKRFVAFTVDNTNPESPVENGSAIIAGTVSDLATIAGKMLRPLGYCVDVPEGLHIIGKTPDFVIGSVSYYQIAAGESVTVEASRQGVEFTGANMPAGTTFNADYTQATFTMPADANVAITGVRYWGTEVPYIDAYGKQATTPAGTKVYVLTGSETKLGVEGTENSPTETWYLCNSTPLNYTSTLSSYNYSNVNIILADGVKMSVESSSSDAIYILGSLGIYGQSTGTNRGALTAKGTSNGIYANNDVTICSAEVTAEGNYAIYTSGGGVSITGGKVTANGIECGIGGSNKNITIEDAEVTATATDDTDGNAIYSWGGSISISYAEVTAEGNNAIYTRGGGISITGGKVTANGTEYGIGAGGSNKDVTIKDSEVTATATGTSGNAIYAFSGGVSITGSKVTANGTSKGISAYNGGVVLDWTNATDFIFASSYEVGDGKVVKTADGQRFVAFTVDNTNPESPVENGSAIIAGTVSDLATIAGMMLRPLDGYCVSLPSGLSIDGKTRDFTIGSTSYYNIAENTSVTVKTDSQQGFEFTGTNVPATTFNADYTQATFAMPAGVDVAITGLRYCDTKVPYIDADGKQATTPAANGTTPATKVYVLDGSETTLGVEGQETWYISKTTGDGLAYNHQITFNGNVHLILADNSKMTVTDDTNYPFNLSPGSSNHNELYIYGQGGTTEGKLTVTSANSAAIHGNSDTDIIINGGIVSATGQTAFSNINSYVANGGKVTLTSTSGTAYKVTFDGNQWSGIPEVSLYSGSTVAEPTAPVRNGYVFGGWKNGSTLYDFNMPVTANLTLVSVWKKLLTNDDIKVDAIEDQAYTGSALTPAVTVKDGETDITDQCDITYSDNTNVGTATVTITAKASSTAYAGETTRIFYIVRPMEKLFSGSNVWTGYVAEEDLFLPDNLTAYIITAFGEGTVTATPLDYVPKGEPVLLKRENNNENSYAGIAGMGTAPTGNLLRVASASSQPTAFRDYGLYQDAFVLIGGGTLATGKVYLPVPQSQSRIATCTIVIEGETTSLRNVNVEVAESEEWFDLQGRKLDGKPAKKGVYIHNGKKEVVR